jgi:hypothetical protein
MFSGRDRLMRSDRLRSQPGLVGTAADRAGSLHGHDTRSRFVCGRSAWLHVEELHSATINLAAPYYTGDPSRGCGIWESGTPSPWHFSRESLVPGPSRLEPGSEREQEQVASDN